MANFKTCDNGHNFDADKHSVCPYCPNSVTISDYEKTLSEFKKTQVFEEQSGSQFDKTMINEETRELKTTLPGSDAPTHPFSRTTIATKNEPNIAGSSTRIQSEKRRIVGWLVTFSLDEFGQDYKLFVGKNIIGSDVKADVTVTDSSVSGNHATILFRENEFLIKDNFSTNGTKINGIMTDEGKLKDGDELKCGNTVFKFKTVF